MKRLRLVLVSMTCAVLALAGLVVTKDLASAATPVGRGPEVYCTPLVQNPARSVRCPVTDGRWRYYQAYMTGRVAPGPLDPGRNEIAYRLQIDARRGSTSIIIQNIWVVYNYGPKTWMATRIQAIHADCTALRYGAWNYNGNYSRDLARIYESDITRWSAISSAAPIGVRFNASRCHPRLDLQLDVSNDDGSYLNTGGWTEHISFY